MFDIIVSIVAFNSDKEMLKKALESFSKTRLKTYIYVIDNSYEDKLKDICVYKDTEYIFNNNNLGFAAGHNIAIRKMIGRTKYSLILNPDVYFNEGTLEKLFDFMEENKDVGLLMPQTLYPDGSLQRLCRLLPSPLDILLRKINIGILHPLFDRKQFQHELEFADYTKIMDVPYLSGCFMFFRTDIFKQVGMFDERFFVHFEDLDLTRRIHKLYRTVYYPHAMIYHKYERGANRDVRIFGYFVASGIKYFNKWGWFFDRERKNINNKVIRNICRSTPT